MAIASIALAEAELYDPASGTWTVTAAWALHGFRHTASLLPNGKILVSGGNDSGGFLTADAELVRSSQRDLDSYRPIDHRAFYSHGDLAGQWQSACRRWND